jgi:bifunctional non-homologous end joining protein LigD
MARSMRPVRARAGAPVATPLEWTELADRRLAPERFTLETVPQRLKRRGDPWGEMARQRHALGPARRRLGKLHSA